MIMKKNNGVTFVEIVLAMAIIIMGLVPVFTIFGTTASDISITIDELTATSYANELLDAFFSHKFEEIPGKIKWCEVDGLSDPFFQKLMKGIAPLKKGFKRYIEITTIDASYAIPQNANPFHKQKLEKLNIFKVIKIKVVFSQNEKPKEISMGTVVTST